MKEQTKSLPHGGDWAGFATECGALPLDFSASVSPLGLPEGVRTAAAQALGKADRYPDPLCRALRRAIAAEEGVAEEMVLCGCGAADLIWRAVGARRPQRALVPAPTFSEYESALRAAHCAVAHSALRRETGFAAGEALLDALTPEVDMAFFCQPNNPTGRALSPALLEAVLARCARAGIFAVVDECFLGFLDDPAAHSAKRFLAVQPGLLVLKAFTKLHAMAGLRLGYALCADRAFLEQMRRCGPPWTVSVPAEAAGIAALRERDYVAQVRALIHAERPRLAAGLAALGCEVIPGEANFLLFRAPVPLLEPLRKQGILLRNCANFRGLGARWYRVAVRRPEENRRLLAAMKSIIEEAKA